MVFHANPSKRLPAILLVGPPCAGKGTQGKILDAIPGFRHFSMGDAFRNVDPSTDLGQQIHQRTSKGQFVSDELTMQILKSALEDLTLSGQYDPSQDLLILDGIPRNVEQAKLLTPFVDVLGVVYLDCGSKDEVLARVKKRSAEESRADDANDIVVVERLKKFRSDTHPILASFDPSLVWRIDATNSPVEVLQRILEYLVPLQRDSRQAFREHLGEFTNGVKPR